MLVVYSCFVMVCSLYISMDYSVFGCQSSENSSKLSTFDSCFLRIYLSPHLCSVVPNEAEQRAAVYSGSCALRCAAPGECSFTPSG